MKSQHADHKKNSHCLAVLLFLLTLWGVGCVSPSPTKEMNSAYLKPVAEIYHADTKLFSLYLTCKNKDENIDVLTDWKVDGVSVNVEHSNIFPTLKMNYPAFILHDLEGKTEHHITAIALIDGKGIPVSCDWRGGLEWTPPNDMYDNELDFTASIVNGAFIDKNGLSFENAVNILHECDCEIFNNSTSMKFSGIRTVFTRISDDNKEEFGVICAFRLLKESPIKYTVQKGDSIQKIAMKHEVKGCDIIKANPELEHNRLKIGQKIIIPRTIQTNGASEAESDVSDNENVYLAAIIGDIPPLQAVTPQLNPLGERYLFNYGYSQPMLFCENEGRYIEELTDWEVDGISVKVRKQEYAPMIGLDFPSYIILTPINGAKKHRITAFAKIGKYKIPVEYTWSSGVEWSVPKNWSENQLTFGAKLIEEEMPAKLGLRFGEKPDSFFSRIESYNGLSVKITVPRGAVVWPSLEGDVVDVDYNWQDPETNRLSYYLSIHGVVPETSSSSLNMPIIDYHAPPPLK